MSFYVTLASSVDYPGNKQNDFTTILSEMYLNFVNEN